MNAENGALVEFYTSAVQNNFKSKEEGRPIFEDHVFIKIQTPGDTRTSIERRATDQDKQRFPKSWDAFQRGMEEVTEGTPLKEWPAITTSQVKELNYVHVRSVESLASLSDAAMQKLGPGYFQLRQQAQHWLEAAKGNAANTEVLRENQELKDKVAFLEEKVQVLEQSLKAELQNSESAKRGPGRPRKEPAIAE